jgi:NAD+ diphosphatase
VVLERLALSRSTLDRAAHRRAEADLVEAALAAPDTAVLLLHGEQAPMRLASAGPSLALLPPREALAALGDASAGCLPLFLGTDDDGRAHIALAVPAPAADHARDTGGTTPGPPSIGLPDATIWSGLRENGALLDDTDAGLLTTAVALANWHATHGRCAQCGDPTRVVQSGWSRTCQTCGADHFPRTDPAVIMSVVDADGRLLLGRQARWPQRRFSTLAGFVEPGESLEAAVRREVLEEAGVVVTVVEYRGSQPWPFPSSLMVGFHAQAVTTDVVVDDAELSEARWWTRQALARDVRDGTLLLPPRVSIARRLIEDWFGEPITDGQEAWR